MNKKIFLLTFVIFIFLNLLAVSAEDNETVIDDASAIDEIAFPTVSIETYPSDESIYIGNSTEVTITVRNIGNCDIDNLSIINVHSLRGVPYRDGEFQPYGGFPYYSDTYSYNPAFNYDDFESVEGLWNQVYFDDSNLTTSGRFNCFILNDTLKINQSCSLKVIYNTTKMAFYNYADVSFFIFSNGTLLNKTFDEIKISQIPRTVYINRKIENKSLVVNASISSLDNSVFSGLFFIKVADYKNQFNYPKKSFSTVGINFINNSGNITLDLPLETYEEHATGYIPYNSFYVPSRYEVYSYKYDYDSFDERLVQPDSVVIEPITPIFPDPFPDPFPDIPIPDIGPFYRHYIKPEDLVKIYKNDSQFVASLEYLESENITFEVNGIAYVRPVNESGFAKLNINLRPGVYTIESYINNHENPSINKITVLPTLIADNLIKYYMNDSQFEIKLIDSSGNPVASQNIKFNINGVFYSRQTDADGIARLNINLSPGEHIVTATDPLTGLNMSYNITVLPVLYADDAMSHSSRCNYWVKLVDGKGNILPGKSITFNIDGLILNNVTDANGEAEIRLNLMPGQYIVTAQYLSAKISNKIIFLEN